jgi:phosphoribosylaminoimidazole carboxylase (NCAIR synthetase)
VHVLFLAPETSAYNLRFVAALKRAGARVSALGHAPRERLAPELARHLDHYARARSLLDAGELEALARAAGRAVALERVETIDEPLVEPAARLRATLGLPGLQPAAARLCRDKAAMKAALRAHGLPVAASAEVQDAGAARAFAERSGYPLVLKPRDGFGTLSTFKLEGADELERALARLAPSAARPLVLEEFVEGHEGFYDTLVVGGMVAHDFVGHYYPSCLAALGDRRITPMIACTNRVELAGYAELRATGARVIAALGLTDAATHMEWFAGPTGLCVSEIGARPAGERIWDMHVAGNDLDLYAEWAEVVLHARTRGRASRRLAVGSVQIRPDKDGVYLGHEGLAEARAAIGARLLECEVPAPGTPTQPLEKGWHVNTWFRVVDPDYDRLRRVLTFVGATVRARAR